MAAARFLLTMGAELRARVGAFQTDMGLKSEAEAVRVLIEMGLSGEGVAAPAQGPGPAAGVRPRPSPAKPEPKEVLKAAEAGAAHLGKAPIPDGFKPTFGYTRPEPGALLKGRRRY